MSNFRLKKINHFKYLDVTINNRNKNYKDNKITTMAVNKYYCKLTNIFKSKQVSFKSKTILYKVSSLDQFSYMYTRYGRQPKKIKEKIAAL